MVATLKLEGAKELGRKLRRLATKSVRKVNTKAVREGLKPIATEAKRKAPVGATKALKKGIGRKTKGYRNGNAIGIVGIRKDRRVPHFHLVEIGHRLVRGENVIGFVKGKHFMEKALKQKSAAAISKFRREMAAGIIREAKKR